MQEEPKFKKWALVCKGKWKWVWYQVPTGTVCKQHYKAKERTLCSGCQDARCTPWQTQKELFLAGEQPENFKCMLEY